MDRLDESTATAIASFLEDERDVASLACANTFWRNVLAPGNDPLWSAVLARRFGDSRKADDCAAHFRQLATLTKPAARLDTIIWLDGHHLRVLEEPGGPLLRLEAVCWLEIGGVLSTGVVPGRYRVAWRLHLEDTSYLDRANLIVQQLAPSGGCQQDDSAVQHEASTLVVWDTLHALSEQSEDGWFWVHSAPFDVAQLCTVRVWLKEIRSGAWKQRVTFDSVRLIRDPPPQHAPVQQPQQPQQVGAGLLAAVRAASSRLVQSVASLLQR
ncbi:hypothetical protein D9Q98_004470 [Chlorella vulgaris]|uniref:F-box domain-containing protein n=1 Tax=Chlorella vulgaris TaxID=3077 RepID=A0A9D4YXB3_CHLVU|nr:hypothetical protein D9Q98_004470 [Chlorella vulgaris]